MKNILYLILFFSFSIAHAHESGGSEKVRCSVKYNYYEPLTFAKYERLIYLMPSMSFVDAHYDIPDDGEPLTIQFIAYFGNKTYQTIGTWWVVKDKGDKRPRTWHVSAIGGFIEHLPEEEFKKKLKPDYCEIIY